MRKIFSNKLFLKDQLLNLHMEEECDVMKHLNELSCCAKDLSPVEVKYEEEDELLLLLWSLPMGPTSCCFSL